jgi:hypothetical protein
VTRFKPSRADLRAFLGRDWSLPRRLQQQETAKLAQDMDWTELLRRADALRDAARWLVSEWPNAQRDEEDLAAHRQQAQRLLRFEERRQGRAAGHRAGDDAAEGAVVPLRGAGRAAPRRALKRRRTSTSPF